MESLGNIVQDLTLIVGSATLAFIISLTLTPWFTKQLIKFKIGKQIRENAISGEKSSLFSALHAKKSGTPTMGGLLIWGTIVVVVIISMILKELNFFKDRYNEFCKHFCGFFFQVFQIKLADESKIVISIIGEFMVFSEKLPDL